MKGLNEISFFMLKRKSTKCFINKAAENLLTCKLS